MILRGWRDQYDRMLRSQSRLLKMASGDLVGNQFSSDGSDASAPVVDALFHFFQDAYHLKDWLIHDDAVSIPRQDIEAAITSSSDLALCADLCNGTKHRKLNPRMARTGDPGTTVVSQSVTIVLGTSRTIINPADPERVPPHTTSTITAATVTVADGAGRVAHSWEVESNSQRIDAETLARSVVTTWNKWLTTWELL